MTIGGQVRCPESPDHGYGGLTPKLDLNKLQHIDFSLGSEGKGNQWARSRTPTRGAAATFDGDRNHLKGKFNWLDCGSQLPICWPCQWHRKFRRLPDLNNNKLCRCLYGSAASPTSSSPLPASLKSCLSRQLTAREPRPSLPHPDPASFHGGGRPETWLASSAMDPEKGRQPYKGDVDFGQRLPAGLVECQYLCASCAWAVFQKAQGAWHYRLRQIKMFALWCGWKYKHDRAEGGVNKKNGNILSWKSGIYGGEVALKIGIVLRPSVRSISD